ncbi:MAG: single-stranded DNA-binding protein [Kiritimatiellae bacterium]|nr:single-stranded DNA-binding protein [Kiritimatiellia bacterium]
MNKFIGVGTLPRNGILNGSDKKVLRFTLATLIGRNKKTKKDIWSYVPCVVFKPSEGTINLLTVDTKGVMIGLEGRVNTSKYEAKDHTTKYSTEVVVDERSIRLLQVTVSGEPAKDKVA